MGVGRRCWGGGGPLAASRPCRWLFSNGGVAREGASRLPTPPGALQGSPHPAKGRKRRADDEAPEEQVGRAGVGGAGNLLHDVQARRILHAVSLQELPSPRASPTVNVTFSRQAKKAKGGEGGGPALAAAAQVGKGHVLCSMVLDDVAHLSLARWGLLLVLHFLRGDASPRLAGPAPVPEVRG